MSFFLIVATIMVPIQLLMIPTFIMFSRMHVINTLTAATIPWLASAFGIFLMRQFFLALPVELEDAARLDGCNRLQVFLAGSCCHWPSPRSRRWRSSRCWARGTT